VIKVQKEINVSGNELQSATELQQAGAVKIGAGKMPWHSPKLRVLQVSQETDRIGSGVPT
jgi:hypothetical protein